MTVDPRQLQPSEVEAEVKKALVGAQTEGQAEDAITRHFSPQPLVWVQKRGNDHFGVLIQPGPGAKAQDILCKKFGFICPDWAKPHWNQQECTIERCADGTFVVLDHSLNGVEVYLGISHEECARWLKPN
jgi:hypothetical protein